MSLQAQELVDIHKMCFRQKISCLSRDEKYQGLEYMYDRQIQILENRKCQDIADIFKSQKKYTLDKSMEMNFVKGYIPFLKVIPFTYVNMAEQLCLIKNRYFSGYTIFVSDEFTNIIETPEEPYDIFNVEDGEDMLGFRSDINKYFKSQGRRGLTVSEIISLGIFTNVLQRHYVFAAASHYQLYYLPYLRLKESWPCLDCFNRWFEDDCNKCGAASCDI